MYNYEKIAIYPYGLEGHKIEKELIQQGRDYIIFDNRFDGKKVLDPKTVSKYSDYHFIVSSVEFVILKEIKTYLLSQGIAEDHITIKIGQFVENNIEHDVSPMLQKLKKQIPSFHDQSEKIIVSLTSFPERINHIESTIKSLMNQTYDNYRVVLWLSEEEFDFQTKGGGYCKIPDDLLKLQNEKFSIEPYSKNIRSYKKLIPTLERYPHLTIVTADDDIIYKENWLQELSKLHKMYPLDVITNKVATIGKDENNRWICVSSRYYRESSYLNKLFGGFGTLYPAHSLHPYVVKKNLFMEAAPTNDDIWFWLMSVLNHRMIRSTKTNIKNCIPSVDTKNTPALHIINRRDQTFFQAIYNILYLFPEISEILEREYEFCKEADKHKLECYKLGIWPEYP